tara:strand:+ start:25185 stop:26246 length:1062 start_codon:yes stop_codon:yes gene_type:complete
MNNFYSLPVINVRKLTKDSVSIKFDVSSLDASAFSFQSGQYITIDHKINDVDVRRAYSISSSPNEGVEIGVKLVEGGLMSTFLTKELKVLDALQIMSPNGNFLLEVNSENNNHYVGICSGSGITPILSMIKNVLENEPNSSFSLIYGNKTTSSVMYSEDLNKLKKLYQKRLFIYYAYSREIVNGAINGRLEVESLTRLFHDNLNLNEAHSYLICGPGSMIENVKDFLEDTNISKNKIKFELFSSSLKEKDIKNKSENINLMSSVTVCIDGDDFDFELSSDGASILESALEAGADVPYSCKGGVCSVCKAKVMEGSATMDINYSLTDEDVEDGFILTCRAHPTSEKLLVDYDEM